MSRKTLLIAGAVLTALVSGAASAQQGPGADARDGRGGPGGARGGMAMGLLLRAADANLDGSVTRAEVSALQAEMFAYQDRNGDGVLDAADRSPLARRLAEMRPDRTGNPWARPRRGNPVDADGDSSITRAEYDARVEAAFTELDANADGAVSVEEARAAAPDRPGRGGGRFGRR